MNPYPKYKPSGIQWIGDIPEHWEIVKLKFIGRSIIGLTYSPEDISETNDGILVLRSSNIQNGRLSMEDTVYIKKDIDEELYTKKGDILLCARNGSSDLIGKNIFIDEKTLGSTFGAFMTIFRTPNWHYIYWFFNSTIFKSQSCSFNTSTINQLTSHTLNNMFVGFPPLPEQTAIATFLDHKTTQIDNAIAKKQKLIELLNEERKAIINEAVIKGINGNAEYKKTGNEWMGKIPEHWEIFKLKFIANLKSGENLTSELIEENGPYPVYGGNGLRGYYSSFTNDGEFILIGRQGALCGNVNFVKGKFWATEHAIVVYKKREINFTWLVELLRIMNLNQYSVAAAQPGLAVERIQNLEIPVPPLKEQMIIAYQIEKQNNSIDNTISKITREIELLAEYRQSLIFEAVTGKIDVRNVSLNNEHL